MSIDPRSRSSIRGSRMPLSIREWIEARVEEGLSARRIAGHVVMGEHSIEEVSSSPWRLKGD